MGQRLATPRDLAQDWVFFLLLKQVSEGLHWRFGSRHPKHRIRASSGRSLLLSWAPPALLRLRPPRAALSTDLAMCLTLHTLAKSVHGETKKSRGLNQEGAQATRRCFMLPLRLQSRLRSSVKEDPNIVFFRRKSPLFSLESFCKAVFFQTILSEMECFF